MSEFRKVAKGAMWYFSAFLLTAVFAYASKVLLARILGPAEYGLFVLSITIAYIFSAFAQSGVAQAVSYFVPKYKGKDKLKSILTILFWFLVISLLIVTLAFIIFPKEISLLFGAPKVQYYLPYILIFIVAYTFVNLLKNIFRSYENAKIPSLIDLLRAALFFVIGVGLTYFFRKSLTPVIAYLVIYISLLFILVYLILGKLEFSRPKKEHLLEVFLFSASMFFIEISSLLLRWTDIWMIGWFKGPTFVGIYNIATTTAYLLNYVINAFLFLFFPIATRLLSNGNKKELHKLATNIIFWDSIVVAPLFFLIFVFSKQIIHFLFGESFILAAMPLTILAFSSLFRNIISTNGNSLLAAGKKKYIVLSLLIAALVNIVLNYLLIPYYGITGAAIATTTAIVVEFSFRWFYARRYNLSPDYRVVVKPLTIAFGLGAILFVLSYFYNFSIYEAIILSIIYLLSYIFLINTFVIKIKSIINRVKSLII